LLLPELSPRSSSSSFFSFFAPPPNMEKTAEEVTGFVSCGTSSQHRTPPRSWESSPWGESRLQRLAMHHPAPSMNARSCGDDLWSCEARAPEGRGGCSMAGIGFARRLLCDD
jgi:hypothetical protein